MLALGYRCKKGGGGEICLDQSEASWQLELEKVVQVEVEVEEVDWPPLHCRLVQYPSPAAWRRNLSAVCQAASTAALHCRVSRAGMVRAEEAAGQLSRAALHTPATRGAEHIYWSTTVLLWGGFGNVSAEVIVS